MRVRCVATPIGPSCRMYSQARQVGAMRVVVQMACVGIFGRQEYCAHAAASQVDARANTTALVAASTAATRAAAKMATSTATTATTTTTALQGVAV